MDKDYCFLGCNALYTKGLFYALIMFLKKLAYIKETKIKNDIPARK
jgi:hypothetical protein